MRRVFFVSICCALLVGAGAAWKGHSASSDVRAIPRCARVHGRPAERVSGRELAHDRRRPQERPLFEPEADHAGERRHAQAGVAHPSRHVPHEGRRSAAPTRGTRSSYDGVYYISTPKSDVFALDATTGAVALAVHADLRPRLPAGVGAEPARRRDRRRPGLHRTGRRLPRRARPETGNVVWKTEVIPWQKGGHLASAPLYYNGMVIEGDSGGDEGSISNDMEAFDADQRPPALGVEHRAGARPAGRQHVDRRPTPTTAAARCGRHPSIDPKLNLVIFGTGNPVPWNSRGPGANL